MSGWKDAELVPISALQHYCFCPRQCALIHVEQVFLDNVFTMRGHDVHQRVDEVRTSTEGLVRVETALPLWSERLGLIGRADVVEFRGEEVVPVEYKAGRRRPGDADDVQLCAQALCLEEMTGRKVERGALFYHASRRRRPVEFTTELRARTEAVVEEVRDLLLGRAVSSRVEEDGRCRHCSLAEVCLPKACGERERVGRLADGLFTVEEGAEDE